MMVERDGEQFSHRLDKAAVNSQMHSIKLCTQEGSLFLASLILFIVFDFTLVVNLAAGFCLTCVKCIDVYMFPSPIFL